MVADVALSTKCSETAAQKLKKGITGRGFSRINANLNNNQVGGEVARQQVDVKSFRSALIRVNPRLHFLPVPAFEVVVAQATVKCRR